MWIACRRQDVIESYVDGKVTTKFISQEPVVTLSNECLSRKMQSKNQSDNDRVLDEVLITRNYVNQVSDSIHQQVWEVRRVAQETRFIAGVVLGLVCLILIIICWKFIAAILIWLAEVILLLYKYLEPAIDSISSRDIALFIFWSILIFIAGFLTIFLVILLKNLWPGSKLQIRTHQIFSKRKIAKIQTELALAEVRNEQVNAERTAYSQRMNEYLQDAQSYLAKQKEAKFKG